MPLLRCLGFVLFLTLLPSAAAGADFLSTPRLVAGADRSWASFQIFNADSGYQEYQLYHWEAESEGWQPEGRFQGILGGLAALESGEVWLVTRDGALVKFGEEDKLLVNPDNQAVILDIAWLGNSLVALDNRENSLALIHPTDEQAWSKPEILVAEAGLVEKAQLLQIGDTTHLVWTSDNADFSGGSLNHLQSVDNGPWRETPPLAVGGDLVFAAYPRDRQLEVFLVTHDPLERGSPPEKYRYALDPEGNWWVQPLPPAQSRPKLDAASDFAVLSLPEERWLWLSNNLNGVEAGLGQPDGLKNIVLASGIGTVANLPFLLYLLFLAFLAFLGWRAVKRSQRLSLTFPGRAALPTCRGVALALDFLLASIGATAFAYGAGYLNHLDDVLTLETTNLLFWVNLTALVILNGISEGFTGTTPGKWLVGLRVRRTIGGPPGLFRSLERNVLRYFDMAPVLFPGLVGWIITLFNGNRQRMGDLVARTVVRHHAPLEKRQFILGSASPRRRELLEALGLKLRCISPNIREADFRQDTPPLTAQAVSEAKAQWVLGQVTLVNELVITADTLVVVDNDILGKPRDAEEAREMLRRLSGRSHRVYTAVTMIDTAMTGTISDVEESEVEFYPLSQETIDRYVESGDGMDKAGAYGVQSSGLVKEVRGSLSNVAGLPMEMLQDMLACRET
ncbi:MAG: Maf family nucleotide pyrophosphatase [Planctomycetota bacterium]|jgi:MAF protein|nr:Maf family nucleotide pyrophosphatase [Planctomycetota bacterium]